MVIAREACFCLKCVEKCILRACVITSPTANCQFRAAEGRDVRILSEKADGVQIAYPGPDQVLPKLIKNGVKIAAEPRDSVFLNFEI